MGVEPAFMRNGPVWPVTPLGPLPSEGTDPSLALPEGVLENGAREALERWWLADQNPAVSTAADEPLGPSPAAAVAARRKKWTIVAVAASLVFHAAVAVFFLEGNEPVLIEGSENAGVTMLGNASEDQVSAGEALEDATSVTLIETVMARPVETIEAQAVAAEAPVEAIEPQAIEVAVAETVQAEATPLEATAETPDVAEPVRAETATPEAAETAPPASVSPTPEVLASDSIASEDDLTAVPPVTEAPATETVEATEPIADVQPEVVAEAVPEAIEETVETPQVVDQVPEPRPDAPVARKKPVEVAEKPEPRKQVEKKKVAKADTKPAEKPVEKPARSKSKAGSGGSNSGDARRGAADGQTTGTTAAAGKKGKTASAGNASVSNYPGKVVAKLRRSLRYPAEARAQRLRGEVRVSFTVSANGSVGGIRVVASSGSPVLDKAAIDTVRRAAPFPAIPDGRASWPFTVPLAFVR